MKHVKFSKAACARLYPLLLAFCALVQSSKARTIYVDNSLAGDCSGTYSVTNRACNGSDGDAFDTLTEAASSAIAGDTVLIRAGTYNERLIPASSGTATAYITFENYQSETVMIVTGSSIAIDISGKSYIIIDGLNVDDSRWLEARNSHYNIIRNNTFTDSLATGTTGNLRFISSHYNKILNNVISNGNDNLLLIDSSHNLVEGNSITEGGHSVWGIRCGNYNVIRGNFFSNSQQKVGEVYDCGEDTYHVPNAFDSTKHNLIEDNEFALTAPASLPERLSQGNGIQYSGQQGIIRRNIFYRARGPALGMQRYSDEALYNNDNRVYNNVFYQNTCGGVGLSRGIQNNLFKNNILYSNEQCGGGGNTQILYRSSFPASNVFQTNNILGSAPGQLVIDNEFDGEYTLAAFSQSHPDEFVANLEVDPGFVDADVYDFNLVSSSSMIDAGAFLTTTVGAGSGTIMRVADASYFYDGFDIPGETGDVVQLEGQSATATILEIDYGGNTLTLSTSLSWSDGQGLGLAYNGSAPDIGAHEFDGPTNGIIYVDGVNGDDSQGNGSEARPYKTIQKALNEANENDTIIVLAGNYPENITLSKQVTVEAQGGLVRIGQ